MVKVTPDNPLAYFKERCNMKHLNWKWEEFIEVYTFKYGSCKIIKEYAIIEIEGVSLSFDSKDEKIPIREYFQDYLWYELKPEVDKVLNSIYHHFLKIQDDASSLYFKGYINNFERQLNEIIQNEPELFQMKGYKQAVNMIVFAINRDYYKIVGRNIQIVENKSNIDKRYHDLTIEQKIDKYLDFLIQDSIFGFTTKKLNELKLCLTKLCKNEDTGNASNFKFDFLDMHKDHVSLIFYYFNEQILETRISNTNFHSFFQKHFIGFEKMTYSNFQRKFSRLPSLSRIDYLPKEIQDFVASRKKRVK
jgi:hypothetical protein